MFSNNRKTSTRPLGPPFKSKTQTLKLEPWSQNPSARTPAPWNPRARSLGPGARTLEPEPWSQNPNPRARTLEPGPWSQDPGARTPQPQPHSQNTTTRAKTLEPRSWSQNPRTLEPESKTLCGIRSEGPFWGLALVCP